MDIILIEYEEWLRGQFPTIPQVLLEALLDCYGVFYPAMEDVEAAIAGGEDTVAAFVDELEEAMDVAEHVGF